MMSDGGAGETSRRSFFAQMLAAIGLLLSYGLLGGYAVAYLFPARVRRKARLLFIGRRVDFAAGSTRTFVDAKGRTLLLRPSGDSIEAFDTRCPHLGCKVHWEPDKDRFFCPCHHGVFNRDGVATAGPPFDAKQSLAHEVLDVDSAGNVFLKVEA
ncbi:MAG: Rieske (2Fe-2S) protein [Deltaproteobacteria bacterium]|nr:Rieske (2Fe-2S) protein [Deltaproteobacteria bacterium]MBI3386955.1 Rieske (2Fe-2S) protein [Deltaproteobacteria bacterium]